MRKTTRLRRRDVLVGAGVALAQTAVGGRGTLAGPPAPLAPPNPPVPAAKPPAPVGIFAKPGVAPGYIISGRGQDLGNPFFHPLGGPSNNRRPTPPAMQGLGVNENDQGENQQ
jgi:hypothetical protein